MSGANFMTYCVAVRIADGMVMLSDTRTNAGIDNISRFSKMFTWEAPGERAIGMMTSGNLSITQGVITRLNKAIEKSSEDPSVDTILNAPAACTASPNWLARRCRVCRIATAI